jgi:hypothetical protein
VFSEYKTRAEAIKEGNLLAQFLDCLKDGAADESCMRGKSVQEVLDAQLQTSQAMKPIPQPFKVHAPAVLMMLINVFLVQASYLWSPK